MKHNAPKALEFDQLFAEDRDQTKHSNENAQESPIFGQDLAVDLYRTDHPDAAPGDFYWDVDWLRWAGKAGCNCSRLSILEPEVAHSFRENILRFANGGTYANESVMTSVRTLMQSLDLYPTRTFNKPWLLKAYTLTAFQVQQGTIRSIFLDWSERYPNAITRDALQHLVSTKKRTFIQSSNVLSDDPEKSWLTDVEYEALLQCIWQNYDSEIVDTQTTLLRLLSMQYARRKIQFAQLKILDVCEGPADADGVSGRRIRFPGAKDRKSKKHFRDSKFEVHPIADHLWDLLQIQKQEVKCLFKTTFNLSLSASDVGRLPLFTTKEKVQNAAEVFAIHYRLDWTEHLDNELFHLDTGRLGKVLNWTGSSPLTSEVSKRVETPLSHRTGRPLVVSATRLRHTRARQLARLGMPKHVLSFWLGHTADQSLDAYYNDPAEEARQINEAMGSALVPMALAFTGKLLDDASQASRATDPDSKLEFAEEGELKNVGNCGKHSFCATTSVPIPCYRCKHFEPLVYAPHEEVLQALLKRQAEEKAMIKIGGTRKLLVPIDLSADIRAVCACIERCDARKVELESQHG